MAQNPVKTVSQQGGLPGQARSFPKWGAVTLLGPALPIDVASYRGCLRFVQTGGKTSLAAFKQPLLETFWGEKRWSSGVNEMNSHLQTGPSGGVSAPSPPSWLPLGRCPRGRTRGGAWEPPPVRGGVQL